jgi:hypothetical protein
MGRSHVLIVQWNIDEPSSALKSRLYTSSKSDQATLIYAVIEISHASSDMTGRRAFAVGA